MPPASDQGRLLNRYTIVPRTLIFLFRGEEILLLKGHPKKKIWANHYNGVGGHIERGESVFHAAQRELVEETGLTIRNLWLCGTIMIDTGENIGIGIFVFKGEADDEFKQAEHIYQSREGELKWMPIDEIWDLPLVEDLPILLPKIIACEKGSPPFSGFYSYDGEGKLTASFNN